MAIIGTLAVLMTARTSKFQKKMKGARKTMTRFGKAAALAAVAVAAATAAMVVQQLAAIDKLAKTSRALGITTSALQALRFAAQIGGMNIEQMDKSLKRLIKSVSDAGRGLSTAVDAFNVLGIDMEKIKNASTDEVFKLIADSVQRLGVNAQTTGAIMDLFGARVGADLVNVLLAGREGIEAFEQEIQAMGLAMSAVDTAQVEEANDAWTRFKKIATAAAQTLTTALAPAITAIIKMLTTTDGQVRAIGSTVRKMAEVTIVVIGWIGNTVQAIQILFAKSASVMVSIFAKLVSWLEKLGIVSEEFAAKVQRLNDGMKKYSEELSSAQWFSEKLNEEMEEATRVAEEVAAATDSSAKAYDGMTEAMEKAAAAQKELNKLQRDAERIINQTRTPLEKYEKQMALLNKLLEQGLIDQETFTRAVKQAQDALDKATAKPGEAPSTSTAPQTRDFQQVVLSRVALGGGAASSVNSQEQKRLESMDDWLRQIKENQERFANQPMILKWA